MMMGILVSSIIVVGFLFLGKLTRHKGGMIIFIILLGFALMTSLFFKNHQCRTLKKSGFSYKLHDRDVFSSWDTVTFYYFLSVEKSGVGPVIDGYGLKVSCRDVDGDSFPEFIVEGKVRGYQTILKVDRESGKYHVQYTDGLKIAYPEEGYHYH